MYECCYNSAPVIGPKYAVIMHNNIIMTVNLIGTGKEMVMPGDDTSLILTLKSEIPLELNQRFTLREGTKTVGTGVVTEIIA